MKVRLAAGYGMTENFYVETLEDAIDAIPAYENPRLVLLDNITVKENITVTNKVLTIHGGGATRYPIYFETNGGSAVTTQFLKKGERVDLPKDPEKKGFAFAGWYTDMSFATKYDFSAATEKTFTLYAAWTPDAKNAIVLTIGEKAASVFGKAAENDVAPKIVNSRTMLPARFIAENLGAKVDWNEEKQQVTITGKHVKTGGNLTILLTIGESKAIVNGKEIALDAAAFVENDRTYTPIRFISECLGADVEWFEAMQQVYIIK